MSPPSHSHPVEDGFVLQVKAMILFHQVNKFLRQYKAQNRLNQSSAFDIRRTKEFGVIQDGINNLW